MTRTGEIRQKLKEFADPEKAKKLQSFFKTGPGEYGEGDIFLGVRVPQIRKLAKSYREITIEEVEELLHSSIHEHRFLALVFLVDLFRKSDKNGQKEIYKLYLANSDFVNNWDLVDSSAEHIVGAYLFERSRKPLLRMVRSKKLWDRRIAIMATFHFIKKNQFEDTLALSEILLEDKHDLIHKAVGWMLREIGARDRKLEETFLKKHYQNMPRTMLRYAIEKFPETKRQKYLKGKI